MDWLHAAAEQVFIWLKDLGYIGILIGLMVEIIPSEIVLGYGGYLVSQGAITFTGAVIFGTIGGTLAQLFLYWIGKYGGRPFLEKYGKYLMIKQKHLELSEKWFANYGVGIVFTARFVPVIRHAISIPAGIVNMPFWLFTGLTVLAVIPWSVFFIYIGKALGDNWRQIDEIAGNYAMPLIVTAVMMALLYLWFERRKQKVGMHSKRAAEQAGKNAVFGPDCIVLDRRIVFAKHSRQRFDQLIISPSGVFFIDRRSDRMDEMYRREYILKELLREHHIQAPVTGVVSAGATPQQSKQGAAFRMIEESRLPDFIHSYGRQKLDQEAINKIAEIIMQNSGIAE